MDPFVFIVGSGRSGTTLIRQILNAHPDMVVPDETHFVPRLARARAKYEGDHGFDAGQLLSDLGTWHQFERLGLPAEQVKAELSAASDYPDAIRRLYRLIAAKEGATRYADKTPRYCMDMALLTVLFPEARFVHVIRDGRDVALSVRGVSFGPDTIGGAALYWRNRALVARRTGEWLGPDRYLEYRHEDLVADTETVTRTICDFIDLPFEPAMLRYHESAERSPHEHHPHVHEPPTKGLRDWRGELDGEDLRLVEILAGDALDELGYDLATSRKTLPAQDEKRLRQEARKLRRKHTLWEAEHFGWVGVPPERDPEARKRFSSRRGRRYTPPPPDEG